MVWQPSGRQSFIDPQRKRRFGMGLIREKLAATQGSAIALAELVMNLEKRLELHFVIYASGYS